MNKILNKWITSVGFRIFLKLTVISFESKSLNPSPLYLFHFLLVCFLPSFTVVCCHFKWYFDWFIHRFYRNIHANAKTKFISIDYFYRFVSRISIIELKLFFIHFLVPGAFLRHFNECLRLWICYPIINHKTHHSKERDSKNVKDKQKNWLDCIMS